MVVFKFYYFGDFLTHMKCVAHSLDLIAKNAMTAMPAHLTFMLRESYNFFAHSALRQHEYKEVLNLVGFENLGDADDEGAGDELLFSSAKGPKKTPLKLISPSQTRWLVMADCNERVLKQYDALSTMFNMAALKLKDKTVRDLSDQFKDNRNRALMIFLNPLLTDLRILTLLFQKKKVDNLKIFAALKDHFNGTCLYCKENLEE